MQEPLNIIAEGRAICLAMEAMGWEFIGGRPETSLRFRRRAEIMRVTIQGRRV